MYVLLPTPESVNGKIVCIRSINNFPKRGYAYLKIFVDGQVSLLFFKYPDWLTGVMSDLASNGLPIHSVRFVKDTFAFHPREECPCSSQELGEQYQ